MADKKEILMRIGDGGGGDLSAECQAALRRDPPDQLMLDFQPGKFFEITNFSLNIGLFDKDAPPPDPKAARTNATRNNARHTAQTSQAQQPEKGPRKFAAWRDGKAGVTYPLEVQPISFSRLMDRASTELLQYLCQSKSYASATIVRRVGTGADDAPRAFLRLEFTPVLVTSVDWSDDDLIKEDYKFICQKMKVKYMPQLADGFLGPAIPGEWPKVS